MINTLHSPTLDRRLLAVTKLTTKGFRVQFNSDSCVVLNGTKQVLSIPLVGNVYMLKTVKDGDAYLVEYASDWSDWKLWHARLGIPTMKTM